MAAEGRQPVALSRFLPVCFEDVVAVVRHHAAAVLADTPPDDSAAGPVRVTLRPGPSAVVSCPVDVHLGPVIEDDDGTVGLPLWWEASRFASWFPTLEAGLELAALPDGTELRLIGGYRTPFGMIGAYADGFIGHRFAIACLNQFLADVTARLVTDLAGTSPTRDTELG